MVDVVLVGLLLMAAGVAAIFLGVMRSSRRGESRVRGAGVVLVGPIPIAFGSDAKWASVALALVIVLMAITLILHVT